MNDLSSATSWDTFFEKMEAASLIRLKDHKGNNVTTDALPTTIAAMVTDDPYRSFME